LAALRVWDLKVTNTRLAKELEGLKGSLSK
jgi:hypothetical protein